jgi:ankyrin repeat protein
MKISDKFIAFLIFIFLLGGCASPAREPQKTGDLNEIKLLIESDPSRINKKNEDGHSLLHIAARAGNADLVKYLASKGADVDIKDNYGETPLQIAAHLDNVDVVIQLVSNGADINVRDSIGKTPLHDAVYSGQFQIVKYLISQGADINTKEINGKSPLHDAVINKNIEIAKYLISNGANVNTKNGDGKSPLHLAAAGGYLDIAHHLTAHGATINVKDKFDRIPLHDAVYDGHLEMAKYLISKDSNVNERGAFYLTWGSFQITLGCTPLHLAAHRGHREIAKYLITQGADTNAKNSRDETPIMLAQQKKHAELVALLAASEKQMKLSKTKTKSQTAHSQTVPSEAPKKSSPNLHSHVDFGRYYALVIGNNDYQFLPKLKTAQNDAKKVAEILKIRYGFNAQLLLDASRSDILLALFNLRKNLSKKDNLLIYFAGHGWLDEKGDEGYWLPIDAEQTNMINWVSNSSITTTLKAMDAKHVLVVADSCYSGKLARGLHTVNRTPGYLFRLSQKKARCVISSGGLEPVIDSGGDDLHSIFASAFINALRDSAEIMDGAQLFNQIRRPVMLNSDQTPEYSDIRKAGHEGGEFIFVPLK